MATAKQIINYPKQVGSDLLNRFFPKQEVKYTPIPQTIVGGTPTTKFPPAPQPNPFAPKPPIRTGGGGGGSGGGGYSYIEPSTGKGFEVSPEGVKTPVIYKPAIPPYGGGGSGSGGGGSQSQQGVVSISNPYAFYRTKEFGKQYADYQRQIQQLANFQGRNTTIKQREEIAQRVFAPIEEIQQAPKTQVVKVIEPQRIIQKNIITESQQKFKENLQKRFDEYKEKYEPKIEKFLSIANIKYAGVGYGKPLGISSGEPIFTQVEIKQFLREPEVGKISREFITFGSQPLGISSKPAFKTSLTPSVFAELLPDTALGLATTLAIPPASKFLPSGVRILGSATFGYFGIKEALNSDATIQRRIAGGIIGTLGIAGVVSEVYPYISGTIARISPKYKPIETEIILGKQVDLIKDIPTTKLKEPYLLNINSELKKSYDIALISEGNKQTGNKPAFLSTAYGFSEAYQKAYIGKKVIVVTSAKSLFPKFSTEIKTTQTIYGTPQDLFTGIAQTRESRLNFVTLKDLFRVSKDAEIGFKKIPQLGVFEDVLITKRGGGGTFRAVGKPSSELEVTTIENLLKGKLLGVTKFGFTKVNIYEAKLRGAGELISEGYSPFDLSSRKPSNIISPSGVSSGLLGTSSNIFSPSSSNIFSPSSSNIFSPSSSKASSNFAFGYSYPSKPSGKPIFPSYPSAPSPKPSPPLFPNAPSFESPSISPPRTPNYPPRSPPSPPRIPNYPPITPIIFGKKYNEKRKKALTRIPLYNLQFRKKGKFIPFATNLSKGEASRLGEFNISRNLLRTFKISKTGGYKDAFEVDIPATPDKLLYREYKIKNKKQIYTPNIFIQKTRDLLQTPEEKKLIQYMRKQKKGGRNKIW